MTDPSRPAVLFVGFTVLAWAVFGAGPLAPIASFQHDTERVDASFSADSDLTVEVGSVRLSPGRVAANGTGNVSVELDVNSTGEVNDSRFALTLAESDRTASVPAASVACSGDDCTLTVPERTVAALADGTGEYELVVRGWWTYDRQFVGRVPVTVTSGSNSVQSNAGADATTTATNTSVTTTQSTTTNTTNSTTTSPTTSTGTATTSTATTPTTSTTSASSTTTDSSTTTTPPESTTTDSSTTTDDTSTTSTTMASTSTTPTTTQETTTTATTGTIGDTSENETTTGS